MQTTQPRRFANQPQEIALEVEIVSSKSKSSWWRRSIRRSHAGQSLAEFAISLPFLIFLLLALVELGFLIRGHLTVTYSVREGARTASQNGDYPPLNSASDTNPLGVGPTAPNYYDLSRVPPGNDPDTLMVANVTSSLQDKLDDAYLLMTYRADSSDKGDLGLNAQIQPTGNNGPFERWGVVYTPKPTAGSGIDSAVLRTLVPWSALKTPFTNAPYQRVFQPIDKTRSLTITGTVGGVTKTATVPYVKLGWIPGVMDGRVFSYTISLPFTLPTTTSNGQTVTGDAPGATAQSLPNALLDSYTVARGIVPPVNDPYAIYSNQLLIWRSTSKCPTVDPMLPIGKYSEVLGRKTTASDFPNSGPNQTGFCGSNNPVDHVNPNVEGYFYNNSDSAVAAAWVADPWFPVWRRPGGACDINKPDLTTNGSQYYNSPKASPNWIGVRVDYKHNFLTNWFGLGTSLNLTDKAVKILEPVPRPSPDWKGCGS